MTTLLIIMLTLVLAAVNGANDNGKGVATLAGSGVTNYRKALRWGHLTTLAGSLASGIFASNMYLLFTKGIVASVPTPNFTFAALLGVTVWVLAATIFKLPVSTTHSIIGSLLGAGLLFSPQSISWGALIPKLAVPLLLSITVSYAASALLNRFFQPQAECACVGVKQMDAVATRIPQLVVINDTSEACRVHSGFLKVHSNKLHWLTSGAVGFSRGLNDTPKIIAFAAATGTLAPISIMLPAAATAMLCGGIWSGNRVVKQLGENVVKMSHSEGFMANFTTCLLVGFGANFGWPMSTTHVSTGAIAGIAGTNSDRLAKKTLRDFLLAWTATPLVSGAVAALSFWFLNRF